GAGALRGVGVQAPPPTRNRRPIILEVRRRGPRENAFPTRRTERRTPVPLSTTVRPPAAFCAGSTTVLEPAVWVTVAAIAAPRFWDRMSLHAWRRTLASRRCYVVAFCSRPMHAERQIWRGDLVSSLVVFMNGGGRGHPGVQTGCRA